MSNLHHHLSRRPGSTTYDEDERPFKQKRAATVSQQQQQDFDRRFGQPTPSPFKRAALIAFVVVIFWLAFNMRRSLYLAKQQQQVTHATRYSKQFKFRPAASPVITEYLKDGRIQVRGAQPL